MSSYHVVLSVPLQLSGPLRCIRWHEQSHPRAISAELLEAVMAGGGRGEVRGAEVMGTVATVAATAEEATVAVALVVTARAAATEAVVQPAVDAMAV